VLLAFSFDIFFEFIFIGTTWAHDRIFPEGGVDETIDRHNGPPEMIVAASSSDLGF